MKERNFKDDLAEALVLFMLSLVLMFSGLMIGAILSFLLK